MVHHVRKATAATVLAVGGLITGIPSTVAAAPAPTVSEPLDAAQLGTADTATGVGGLTFRVPSNLGTPSTFEYEFDDIDFDSTVWESESSAAGWQVDLHITVMRGPALRTPIELFAWFTAYQERPTDEVDYRPIRIHGQRGWRSDDQVFWLLHPGLAVSVTIDPSRWSELDLLRTVRSCR